MTESSQNVQETQVSQDEAVVDEVVVEESTSSSTEDSESVLSEEQKKINALELELETLRESEKQAKDDALRALAEMENFKKRNQQEVLSFKKYAAESTISVLLPILDNFILACNHLEQQGDEIKKELEGVLLIRKQFLDALQKVNVVAIDAVDQPFDPYLHQAISQESVEGKDAGVVVKELQKGFKLHDRVIRPSLVVVSV